MNCRQFEQQLHIVLDQRLAPEQDALLAEHAWHCAACREALQIQQQLLQLISEGPPRVELADRVVASFKARPNTRRGWTGRLRLLAALAAAMLLAAIPLARLWNQSPPSSTTTTTTTTVAQQPSDQQPVTTQSNELQLAQDFEFVEQLPPEYRLLVTTITAQINDVDPRQSVDQLAGGLRQYSSPFGIAIDVLRRNLPPRNKDKQREPQASARPAQWVA